MFKFHLIVHILFTHFGHSSLPNCSFLSLSLSLSSLAGPWIFPENFKNFLGKIFFCFPISNQPVLWSKWSCLNAFDQELVSLFVCLFFFVCVAISPDWLIVFLCLLQKFEGEGIIGFVSLCGGRQRWRVKAVHRGKVCPWRRIRLSKGRRKPLVVRMEAPIPSESRWRCLVRCMFEWCLNIF